MENLKEIPDRVLVDVLRGRGYEVSAKKIDAMTTLQAEDVQRIKGDATWSQLVMQNYDRARQVDDLELVHRLATTPGGKKIKVYLPAGPTKLVLDLQRRWGTKLAETVRALMYLAETFDQDRPAEGDAV